MALSNTENLAVVSKVRKSEVLVEFFEEIVSFWPIIRIREKVPCIPTMHKLMKFGCFAYVLAYVRSTTSKRKYLNCEDNFHKIV